MNQRTVLHPTDFSRASELAFAHALAYAVARQAKLVLLHVDKDKKNDHWMDFPAVRSTLQRWGYLQENSHREDVFEKLGVLVKKHTIHKSNITAGILNYIKEAPASLMVLASEGREGVPRLLHGSIAESLARHSKVMTLFVPHGSQGFVSLQDGSVSLQRILCPIDKTPSPNLMLERVATHAGMVAQATGQAVEVQLLYVGKEPNMPAVNLPEVPMVYWSEIIHEGQVAEEILTASDRFNTDMIAMATQTKHRLKNLIHGSTTEKVLRQTSCPLLAVPT